MTRPSRVIGGSRDLLFYTRSTKLTSSEVIVLIFPESIVPRMAGATRAALPRAVGLDVGVKAFGWGQGPPASLRRQWDLDELVATTHTDSQVDRSRAAGRHGATVHSWLGKSPHRNVFHAAVRHVRDEQDAEKLHGLASRIQKTHRVGITPSPRYRLAQEFRAIRAP